MLLQLLGFYITNKTAQLIGSVQLPGNYNAGYAPAAGRNQTAYLASNYVGYTVAAWNATATIEFFKYFPGMPVVPLGISIMLVKALIGIPPQNDNPSTDNGMLMYE